MDSNFEKIFITEQSLTDHQEKKNAKLRAKMEEEKIKKGLSEPLLTFERREVNQGQESDKSKHVLEGNVNISKKLTSSADLLEPSLESMSKGGIDIESADVPKKRKKKSPKTVEKTKIKPPGIPVKEFEKLHKEKKGKKSIKRKTKRSLKEIKWISY